MFKTISEKYVSAEIVEKKSRFIANMYYVETVEEAENKIKELKKKYYDARHNCYAFSIFSKEGITNRFSDDGEPNGTAGSPMLNIINSKELTNVLVVVTRYFGGILLGTGGLVRAYTGALQEALSKIDEVKMDIGLEIKLQVTYSDLEKLKYYLVQKNIDIYNIEYNENVDVYINIVEEKYKEMLNAKNDLNFNIIKNEFIKEKYIKI